MIHNPLGMTFYCSSVCMVIMILTLDTVSLLGQGARAVQQRLRARTLPHVQSERSKLPAGENELAGHAVHAPPDAMSE